MDDGIVRYYVEFSEAADAELDVALLRRLRTSSPEAVTRWHAGLKQAAFSLNTFPRRYSLLPYSGSEGEVRRIVYGRGSSAYYIIYRVFDPADGDTERLVSILHVRHAAGRTSDGPANDEDET